VLLAGEPSGDHHAALLARALKDRFPDVRLSGTGGPAMAAEGVRLLAGLEDLAVMGFVEVARRLRFFRGLERRVRAHIAGDPDPADLVIPIDYPGFNMRAARHAHGLGIPVLYYIAPQVWAWKRGRARRLAEVTRHVAVILPFEVEVLEEAGARATFVGHPLLERSDAVPSEAAFRARWSLDPERPVLALLPGSRIQEIGRHLDAFVGAAELLRTRGHEIQPVIARSPTVPPTEYRGAPFPLVEDTRALLRYARAALVKSGTSTLEAALERTPFVVAYRTSWPTWEIARRVVQVDHVALANVVAGRRLVPELLQDEVRPQALADALAPLWDRDSPIRARQLEGFDEVRAALGAPGASARVAALAAEILEPAR
jgi:lipid-A-disaccharide synthase